MGSRLHFAGVRFKNCGAGLYPDHFRGPYDRDIPSSRGRIAFQRRCVLLHFSPLAVGRVLHCRPDQHPHPPHGI